MQNKAKLPDAQMNVMSFLRTDYGDSAALKLRKNKAKTKPMCKRRPRNLLSRAKNNDLPKNAPKFSSKSPSSKNMHFCFKFAA
jgi:hypothetical protein